MKSATYFRFLALHFWTFFIRVSRKIAM